MTRSWWENEDILRRFRDWLIQTTDEVESLAEPSIGSSTVVDGPMSIVANRDAPAPDLPEVGLLQLVEAFSAMRHELKLFTKGTRNLEDTVERSLDGLNAASHTFQSVQAKEREAAQRAALPLVETLIGIDEGLLRAKQAFQAAHRQLTQTGPVRLREILDKQLTAQRWWRRWALRRWHARIRNLACDALAQVADQEFASLMEGFQMLQNRLEQALDDHGICRVDATGGSVDPTRMTVVELVTDSEQRPETVVDIVRPGYVWGDRVVRFAEVRAVASSQPMPAVDSVSDADEWNRLSVLRGEGEKESCE